MKYVISYRGGRGPLVLDDDSDARSVAAECRSAALAFLAGASRGWRKAGLAAWLTGPYASTVRHAGHGERIAGLDGVAEVTEHAIDELVVRVRGQLLASLEAAALATGSPDFLGESLERGFVRKALDGGGAEVWIPLDYARMRLRERVQSLFAADFLNAPESYAEMFVCHRCEMVVFDRAAKEQGVCTSHNTVSDVVPRARASEPRGRTGTDDGRDGENVVPRSSAS